ncbi:amidase [Podospora aff. communis PSN243]|uniref:Amidase n=1 Tax=Podospora aff. communis PSN243 TaxID=3040156 RepID=A0AAV9GIL0_9PEZI|nr:amidase [Podospora aff. communis PSN243]
MSLEFAAPPALPQSIVVRVGSDSYFIRPRVECTFRLPSHLSPADRRLLSASKATFPDYFPAPAAGQIVPAAVIYHGGETSLSPEAVKDSFARFLRDDDVFQTGFTSNAYLIVQTPNGPHDRSSEESVLPALADFLKSSALTIFFATELPVVEGPYFVLGRSLHESWRLHPDHLGAFAVTTIPNDTAPESGPTGEPQRFRSLQVAAFNGASGPVAVPSRLYAKPGQPLAGKRIAVKDNMHLSGVVTGLGNRAYAELYGAQSKTAEFIQLLMDNGATVVGKTKLSAFAGSEVPPTQCIDYFPPWNPRGDGYQGPSGSSSGAGASAAGYDWLDISLCTDTTGSMRFPATSHGVWGQRVTWDTLPLEGVVPACRPYDTFGLLARSPAIIRDVLRVGGNAVRSAHWPTKLLYPSEWFPVANKEQQQMNLEFLKALENYLGLKHTKFSVEEEWKRTGPEHLRDRMVADIEKLSHIVNVYDNYHLFEDFRSEYRQTFGKPPYVSPSHTKRWYGFLSPKFTASARFTGSDFDFNRKDGEAKTRESRDEAEGIVNEFREWSRKHLFVGESEDSSAIILVPHGRPGANYRDSGDAAPAAASKETTTPAPSSSAPPPRCGAVFTMSMVGAPQLIVPIGQNPYHSRVSDRTEYAPIGTSIVGPPGSDATLVKIAQEALRKAGWPTTVLTARLMFKLGDNARHTAGVAGDSGTPELVVQT